MTPAEAQVKAAHILKVAGVTPPPDINFLEFAICVGEAAKSLGPNARARIPWFAEFAVAWRTLFDDFEAIVAADPGIQYTPRNQAAFDFHSSTAFMRYFRAGNRTSKTQSGYMEHYFVATQQHRFRQYPKGPSASFIVAGLPFTSYKGGVFETKFITGEVGNPLSPLFPEGGKWFYHYDPREYVLTLGCPACAEAGKASSCKHSKSKIKLFSVEQSREDLQGQAYLLGHYDEDVLDEGFFHEGRQRVKTVKGGCLILTGTPLHGDQAWEQRYVAKVAEAGGSENRLDPSDPNSIPLVSMHTVSMWDGGIVPHAQIHMEARLMDEFQVKARIEGVPMPLAERPVFDRAAITAQKQLVKTPSRGHLISDNPELAQLKDDAKFTFAVDEQGPLRLWKAPEPDTIYMVAVDTASGLYAGDRTRQGDPSCATVLKLTARNGAMHMELVAQYHGWITPLDYADEVYKIALWYNSALLVVELTGGLGLAVVQKIKQDYAYWRLYRDQADHAAAATHIDARYGVDTNASTKPFMVSSLQSFIKDRRLSIPCIDTLQELLAFEQEVTGKGGVKLSSPRYRGAHGTNDDRVMSLAIASAVAVSYEPLHYEVQAKVLPTKKADLGPVWRQILAEIKEDQTFDPFA